MPINAPYNFVPLSKNVYFPDWAHKISHDLPFKDGLSGTIQLELTAKTALSIGGDRGNDGTVQFFQLPNGKYAIPGSSIRGMIRNVFEIATFSKLQALDNQTFGLRALNGDHVKELYRNAIAGKQKAGFLKLIEGKPTIIPCNCARIAHKELIDKLGLTDKDLFFHKEKKYSKKERKKIEIDRHDLFSPQKGRQKNLSDKINYWETLCKNKGISNPNRLTGTINNETLEVDSFDLTGKYQLVLTGQVNWLKRKDFVFYDKKEEETIDIKKDDPMAWGDFLSIHGDSDKSSQSRTRPWNGYWKEKFFAGEEVPIFYIEEEKRLRFSLAYMMKLAGDYHTHDLVKHSSEKHFDDEIDLTEAVFGKANEADTNSSLKGRVYFELAETSAKEIGITKPMALASPKPSYFPNYLKQQSEKLQQDKQYNTYLKHGHHKSELRGWKRYPVTENAKRENSQATDEVSTRLSTLPKGTKFTSRIIFHNLKPVELGALLWSLKLNDGIHSIGTGKAFQFGQVTLSSELESLAPSQHDNDHLINCDELIKCFTTQMEEEITDWSETPQIKTLLAMTSYQKKDDINFKGELKHMTLDINDHKKNEFNNAIGGGYSLSNYIKVNTGLDISEEKKTWENALIRQDAGNPKVTATKDGKVAFILDGNDLINSLSLSKNQIKKLRKGQLKLKAEIKIKEKELTILKLEKPPQP